MMVMIGVLFGGLYYYNWKFVSIISSSIMAMVKNMNKMRTMVKVLIFLEQQGISSSIGTYKAHTNATLGALRSFSKSPHLSNVVASVFFGVDEAVAAGPFI